MADDTKQDSRIEPPRPRTERDPLTRDQILDAATAFIDENGLPALTMRSLGNRLGVEAMSLYRYVNGREDLLEGMVARLVQRLRLDPHGSDAPPADGWQAYLQWLAHAVRNLAHRHPNAFPLVATRHPAAPWLRPPLRSLDVVEDFLVALTSRGFSDESAVAAYRTFSSFLLGHLLLESASRGAKTSPAELAFDEGDAEVPDDDLPAEDYPVTLRLRRLLSEDHADAEFEAALEHVLDRLDRLVSE